MKKKKLITLAATLCCGTMLLASCKADKKVNESNQTEQKQEEKTRDDGWYEMVQRYIDRPEGEYQKAFKKEFKGAKFSDLKIIYGGDGKYYDYPFRQPLNIEQLHDKKTGQDYPRSASDDYLKATVDKVKLTKKALKITVNRRFTKLNKNLQLGTVVLMTDRIDQIRRDVVMKEKDKSVTFKWGEIPFEGGEKAYQTIQKFQGKENLTPDEETKLKNAQSELLKLNESKVQAIEDLPIKVIFNGKTIIKVRALKDTYASPISGFYWKAYQRKDVVQYF